MRRRTKTTGNTVLITDGASGIGFALAEALAKNEYEIVVGETTGLVTGARTDPERAFQDINQW